MRFRNAVVAASTLVLLGSGVPVAHAAQSNQMSAVKDAAKHLPRPERPREVKDREFDPHSVLVRFKSGASAAAKDRALTSRGASRVGEVRGTGYVEVRAKGAAPDLLRRLRNDPAVAEVSLDYQRRTAALPNDPYFAGSQSYLDTVRLQQAWDLSKGSTSQIIAVVDTGVDGLHADLQGVTVDGYNAITGAAVAAGTNSDDNGHGSMVAGIAAANTGNGIGIAGAAWTARVMPVKVLGVSGSGYDSDIAAGITWAADHGATIVNLSLGGPADSPLLHDAVTYATGKGALVVVAAGNYGSGLPLYPAAYPEVLAVGATDKAGNLTDFSSWGDHIDVAAPGFDIVSTGRDQTYVVGDGTSFAAPIASGVAALVRTANPSWTPQQVIDRLRATARDAGPRGIDSYYGYGVLDAYHAVGGTPGGEFPARALGANEPNDAPARATAVATSVTGTLAAEGDVDWYRFDSAGQQAVDVTVTPPARDTNIAQNADPILAVYDRDLRLIGRVDSAGRGGAETLSFVADTGTYYVAVSNYNGAADSRSYTLAVGAGTASLFQPPVETDIGAEARTVDIADVTGDGREDVLLATSYSTGSENGDKLFVYAQRPDGTLAPPVRYGTDAVPHQCFAVLDTNGDGRQDVAINTVSGINVLRQNASGTLESAGLLPTKGCPVAGDMDGDGDSDLVATASGVGTTLLTQGDDGTFTPTAVTTDDVGEVEVGDVDGDGKIEIVAAPPVYLGNAPIYVYHPTEAGWTRTNHPTGMTSPETVSGIEVADVSGDGRADILATFGGNKPSSQVSVLRQNATGGFDTPALYPVWDIPEPIEAADVTGDSRLDAVTVHGGWAALSVLPQTADGTLGAPVRTDTRASASSFTTQGLALGDIDGDGRTDAVMADYNDGLVVLRNNNGPTRGGPQMWVRDVAPADFASEVASAAVPSVTFQRAVDAESVSSSTVRLLNGRTGAAVAATVSYDAGSHTARVTPAVALQDDTPYRLVVEGVRDTTGETQTERFTSTFSTVDTAPDPVSNFVATGAMREATLSWTVPPIADFDQVIVRMATGTTAPSSVTSGTAVYAGSGSSVTASGLTAGVTYTFAAWVRDRSGKLSTASTVTLPGSAVTISSSSKTVNYGSPVSVTGRLTRSDTRAAIPGASVQLYARREGFTIWSLVGTATSSSTGDVSLSHTPSASTDYQWIYPGSTAYTGAESPIRAVQVRMR
ncbi:Repeat domain-containing protein [Micromonospora rhizosphaerae]|uniref:Repeat domain-containing protein n=1 Tax=Micromonospora rhizosphaerae TaxID=568872 RepID=A0A1C6RKG9_9ACTN|nr:S8 family serine peptidase [Micromonospora rhizosphaerae]SCL17659.1 Repeat domain-containing protein [Micromonospora rhizosphaerae]